jgi:hypothetical protein
MDVVDEASVADDSEDAVAFDSSMIADNAANMFVSLLALSLDCQLCQMIEPTALASAATYASFVNACFKDSVASTVLSSTESSNAS